MVNPFELTIRSSIQWNEQVVKVVELRHNPKTAFTTIVVQTENGFFVECNSGELSPIPISIDLIKQLGFEQELEYVYRFRSVILKQYGTHWIFETCEMVNTSLKVEFLHQLQFVLINQKLSYEIR